MTCIWRVHICRECDMLNYISNDYSGVHCSYRLFLKVPLWTSQQYFVTEGRSVGTSCGDLPCLRQVTTRKYRNIYHDMILTFNMSMSHLYVTPKRHINLCSRIASSITFSKSHLVNVQYLILVRIEISLTLQCTISTSPPISIKASLLTNWYLRYRRGA